MRNSSRTHTPIRLHSFKRDPWEKHAVSIWEVQKSGHLIWTRKTRILHTRPQNRTPQVLETPMLGTIDVPKVHQELRGRGSPKDEICLGLHGSWLDVPHPKNGTYLQRLAVFYRNCNKGTRIIALQGRRHFFENELLEHGALHVCQRKRRG